MSENTTAATVARTLANHPDGITVRDLVTEAGVGQSTAAKTLAAMETAGTATRTPGPANGNRKGADIWRPVADDATATPDEVRHRPCLHHPLAATRQPVRPARLDACRAQRHPPPHRPAAVTDPAEALLTICRRLVGTDARPVAVHQGHDGTVVLRAATASGEVIVKLNRGLDRHRQEVHAYRHWTSALRGRAPRLLASTENPPAIVVTALPGRTLAEADLNPQQEIEAHRQAGELLHRLHAAAPSRMEPDMTAWLAERGEHWLALGRAIIPAHRQAEIRAHLTALSDLGPIPAVPCHLDYTPRNLLAEPSGRLAVIDFEHARYDLAARDLVRLATRIWPSRPDLEDAFVVGYGPLSALDRQVIEHCTHLDALTSNVRGAGRAAPTVLVLTDGA